MKVTYPCGHWVDYSGTDKPKVKCPVCARMPKKQEPKKEDFSEESKKEKMKEPAEKKTFTGSGYGINTK